ncbi:unnamed protein product, partial [Mesorhabditis belari]|uniref:Protein-S-isoprenylcysteine O-methyltransferase n=1 Tax=Mesorhabditis belari TaxID=2138241 RepID=A0AAF3EA11_9BILA
MSDHRSSFIHLIRHVSSTQLRADPMLQCATSTFAACFLYSIVISYLWTYTIACLCISGFFAQFLYRWIKGHDFNYWIAVQSAFLGLVFGCSISHSLHSSAEITDPKSLFCRYIAVLAFFHYTEFLFTAISNRRSLKIDSFLLNHSRAYWAAAVTSWLEFWMEATLFPNMKFSFASWLGVGICIIGEIIRKVAMIQAGIGFTHSLAIKKHSDHHLVTEGIYGWCRHPGYLGWFIWSISTQIVLCNPLCLGLYAFASFKFFNSRIIDEERDLLHFFGSAYEMYQNDVPTGIPWIEGYRLRR